jgi:hypothetical protein
MLTKRFKFYFRFNLEIVKSFVHVYNVDIFNLNIVYLSPVKRVLFQRLSLLIIFKSPVMEYTDGVYFKKKESCGYNHI